MVKLPGYIVEFQIALDGVKRYTGWTDVELAKRLGVTDRTLQRQWRIDPTNSRYVEKIPAKGRGDMRRRK